MRKSLTIDIDAEVLRRIEIKADAEARSTASYVAALLGRDVFGESYSDLEVITHKGAGRGTVLRVAGESDKDYEERKKTVERLLKFSGL